MILVVDNFDSFTWNLVHGLIMAGAEVIVRRNDAIGVEAAVTGDFAGIVLSPGPGTPDDAGVCLSLVAACAHARLPLLGVCLGHQAIARHYGMTIARGGLMHGKTAMLRHDDSGVFAGLPSPFSVARYHSLLATPTDGAIPADLIANAWCDGDADENNAGEEGGRDAIMGLRHRDRPIHGVQFHPESIATEHGVRLLRGFVAMTQEP